MEERDTLEYLNLPTTLYNKIEENVVNLLTQLNITSYPIDPTAIAIALGYELIPYPHISDEDKLRFSIDEFDAISFFDSNRKVYKIYYKPDGLKERFRFTIAHEIGHIRMGHKCESELARRIADYYAAYLLAPTPWISAAGCEDFADVAAEFSLSRKCAMRCFDRYLRWCELSFTKKYERKLLLLLNNNKQK